MEKFKGIYRIDKPRLRNHDYGDESCLCYTRYISALKTYATTNEIPFSWQPGYYDSVMRSKEDLNVGSCGERQIGLKVRKT